MRVAVLITGQLRDYKVNVLNHIKHLIEPNNADVFVYACSKNTLHTVGSSVEQRYNITTTQSKEEILRDVKELYGQYLKGVLVNENEELDEANFGTLGYFRRRMQNQMDGIRIGFLTAKKYSQENGFEYDAIVRCRPDNSMFPRLIDLTDESLDLSANAIYSTIFYTGHRDPWFFAFGNPQAFDKYCALKYLEGADGARTDNNFDCPEITMEKYLASISVGLRYCTDICLPFTQVDKTQPVRDFPYRKKEEKLIDASGNLVDQVD